jgi:hypothetical protein
MYTKQPLPKPFLVAFFALSFLGAIGGLVYSYRKGFVFWGHPSGGYGPGSWGPPYNKIFKNTEPKKYWLLFWFQAAIALIFLIMAASAYLYNDA